MYIGNIELDGQFSYQIFIHVTAIRGTFTPRPDVETKYLVNRAVHLWERKEMNAAELVNFTPKPFKVGGTSEHIENLLIITN